VNKTFWSRITDIKIELYLKIPVEGVNGEDLNILIYEELQPQQITDIDRNIKWLGIEWRKNRFDSYAYRPLIERDLEAALEEKKHAKLELKVVSRHGLSGYLTVTKHEYSRRPSPFVKGKFHKGNNVKVDPD